MIMTIRIHILLNVTDTMAIRRRIERWKRSKKENLRKRKSVLTLVQTSKTPNKIIRALMLRFLVRTIMTSGEEEAGRPCDSSMAIGVYPRKRRRGICIGARHPRDERPIAQRSPNRTEENRTSGQSPLRASVGLFSTTTRAATQEKKRREEKRRDEEEEEKEERRAWYIIETWWPAPPIGRAKSTRRRYTHRLWDRRT